MSQVTVLVKVKVKEGQREAMTDAVRPGIETAKGEVGTQFYVFHHDLVEPNTVWFYELYEDDLKTATRLLHASSEIIPCHAQPVLNAKL